MIDDMNEETEFEEFLENDKTSIFDRMRMVAAQQNRDDKHIYEGR